MLDSTPSDQDLANALPDGVVVTDAELQVKWFNSKAQCFLNIKREAASITDTLGEELSKQLLSLSIDECIEINSPVDEHVRLSLCLRPYKKKSYVLVLKDMTHQYHLEAIRQDFVANVSHELRTPLTVFHGYLDLLLSNNEVEQEKLQEILQHMSGQTARMERLVEDLLLLAKLESVEPDVSKHSEQSVAVLFKEVAHDAASLSEGQHDISIDVDDTFTVQGDPHELRSAVSNLVFNAVRYTPERGKIELCGYTKNDSLVIEVRDNGIGIAEKHISRITQRFYRVDKSRKYRGQGGTGLGLAIVKHVAIRHHAELQIESECGQGSVFRLLFPVF